MKRSNQNVLILITFGGILMALTVVWSVKPEPTYNGKTASQWEQIFRGRAFADDIPLSDSDHAREREAIKAVHEMRDAVLPVALRDIQCQTPAWPSHLAEKLMSTRYFRWCPNFVLRLLQEDPAGDGLMYFQMLGPDASPAVPELTNILRQTKSVRVRLQTINALAQIGEAGFRPLMNELANTNFPTQVAVMFAIVVVHERGATVTPALPCLLENLTNTDQNISVTAFRVLGELAVEPAVVVPALTNRMQDADENRRREAILELRRFGDKARSALPALKLALTDPDEPARYFATNALQVVAPDVAAQMGIWVPGSQP
jgi:hypothetical protein